MLRTIPHERYLAVLGVLFAVVFTLGAISPWYFMDWLIENSLAVLAVALIWFFRRRLLLSRISYTLIFLFLCLHEVGAHYTYAKVPYDHWFQSLFGHTVSELTGWQRNHFDRLVHFAYGLLIAYPIREILLRIASVRGFWGYFLPLDLTMSTSMLYELMEWGTAVVVASELGHAYLGAQGDIWDAQKDMALASAGALVAMLITATLNWRLQRDFASEWAESLRVKDPRPLGEDEIARLAADRSATAPVKLTEP